MEKLENLLYKNANNIDKLTDLIAIILEQIRELKEEIRNIREDLVKL